jgi:serine phosphatase RsbU (regulator of sigma subunit)
VANGDTCDSGDKTALFFHRSVPAPEKGAGFARYLLIAEGSEKGRHLELTGVPVTIGRRADCTLCLIDPCVSKHHGLVTVERDQVWITDLNSTNGTFLNGERVTGRMLWPDGKPVRIGNHVLRHEVRDKREFEASEKLAEDLRKASAYVQSLLPAPLPDGPVRVDWCFVPSAVLGGDCFGYHWLDHDRFAFYLVDVCGHGVGPAMHSVSVINMLRNQTLGGVDFGQPSEVLARLNEALPMEHHGEMFFSIWYGVYRRSDRRLLYASGGHPPALLLRPEGGGPRELHTPSLFLGMLPRRDYPQQAETLEPGSTLCVFSDGVFEIVTEAGTEWSLGEFRKLLADGDPPSLRADGIHRRVVGLAKDGRLDDDFSLIILRFA